MPVYYGRVAMPGVTEQRFSSSPSGTQEWDKRMLQKLSAVSGMREGREIRTGSALERLRQSGVMAKLGAEQAFEKPLQEAQIGYYGAGTGKLGAETAMTKLDIKHGTEWAPKILADLLGESSKNDGSITANMMNRGLADYSKNAYRGTTGKLPITSPTGLGDKRKEDMLSEMIEQGMFSKYIGM